MQRDGLIVKIVRELQGMSQAALAEKVDLSEPTIARLEQGKKTVKATTRARVAEALGLLFDWKSRAIVPPKDIPAEAFEQSVDEAIARAERTIEEAAAVIAKLVTSGLVDKGTALEKVRVAASRSIAAHEKAQKKRKGRP